MDDNVTLPGAGEQIATEDIGGVHYQFYKLTDGQPGSVVRARVKATNADATDAGIVVRPTPQDTWSVSFTRVSASALNSPEMTQRRLGTGMGVSQSAGNLVVTTGTTANSEFLARSTVTFNGALIERHQTILSQRIANNNFAVLLADRIAEGASCTINSATSITVTVTAHGFTAANVGQSMNIGAINGANGVPGRYAIASIPSVDAITFTVAGWPASGSCTVDLFGWNYVRWLYSGTTATAAAIDAQRYGWNSGDTTATINTTASPGHMAQTAIDGRNIYFSDTLVASSTTPAVAVRGHRYVNIPDDEIELFMYLWAFNGSTAPASTTTWTVGFVAVEDVVNTPVYLAGIRQQGFSSPLSVVFPTAQPVSGTFWQATQPVSLATNTPTLAAGTALAADFGVQYRASATGAASFVSVLSPATPASATIKGSAGRIVGWQLQNSSTGLRSVKVFNATAPTLGTTPAAFEIDIPAGGKDVVQLPGGIAFATAMTYSVTAAKGLTDNTATGLAANDVSGSFFFA
jgi:hypothetical protein